MPVPTKLSHVSNGPKRRGLAMRRQPSQARAQLTFSTVLEAAVGLIEREGVERATTRRIALAAGVSIGAVYEYFPNKESIVLYLGTSWLRRIRDVVDALHPCRSGIADLLGYVNRMLDDVGRLYRGQPGLLAVVRLIGAIPELREAEESHDAAVINSVTSALKHFASDADLVELQTVASYMVLISHSVLSECLVVQTGDADRMLRMLRMSIYALISPFLLPPPGSDRGA
ncbi:MAG TPA: TetR/AcrR family transcriptional regulator [Steroidobacteraceae bacterium]|nr:TetR/AcrR family transcriptional regulator [Steroidobacteraceae bacterium]